MHNIVAINLTTGVCEQVPFPCPPVIGAQNPILSVINGIVTLNVNAMWAALGLKNCAGGVLPIASSLATCADIVPPIQVTNFQTIGNTLRITESNGDIHDTILPAPVVDINVANVGFNAITNVLTVTETDGTVHSVDLTDLVDAHPNAQAHVDAVQAVATAHCDMVNGHTSAVDVALGVQNLQVAQTDLAPSGILNYGLRVDPAGICTQFVPYASDSLSGVIERSAYGSMEAQQDHNLAANNLLTAPAAMADKFRLDDLRALTARSAQEWFEQNFWITNSRTYAIPSARFPTLDSFVEYIKDYRFHPDVVISVMLAAGDFPLSNISYGHHQGSQIILTGAALVGAIPTKADIANTGMTPAIRAANYATTRAAVKPRYRTILQGVMRTSGSLQSFRMKDIYIEGSISIQGSQTDFPGYYWDNLFVDGGTAPLLGIGIELNRTKMTNCRNVFVIGLYIAGGITLSSSVVSVENSLISAYSATCIISRHNTSQLVSLGELVTYGSAVVGISSLESGSILMLGSSEARWHNTYCLSAADAGSSVVIGGAGPHIYNQSGQAAVNASLGGKISRHSLSFPTVMDIGNAPVGLNVRTDGSFQFDLGNLALAIHDCTSRGVYAEQGSITIPLTTTFTANAFDVQVINCTRMDTNGATIGTASPPVGTVGNNNSLIHI